jgi:hypothetical protein
MESTRHNLGSAGIVHRVQGQILSGEDSNRLSSHSGHERGCMEHNNVEKLLYSRRDAAEALSLSIRSVDYLITAGRLATRRVGGKILIPASAVRRFAREDHPDSVRTLAQRATGQKSENLESPEAPSRCFQPRSEDPEGSAPLRATNHR